MANRPQPPQRHSSILLTVFVFIAATALAATDHSKPKQPPLENFYIVTQAIFHTDPKWVDHILEVRPEEAGVRVREIRVAPLNPTCPHHVTVRAIERVVPKTTVQRVALHFALCAFSEDDVEGMIGAAKRKTGYASDDDSAAQTIVARCGTRQRVFELPDKDSLRFDALTLADSRLAAFWDLAAAVEARTFGDDFSLAKLTPEQDRDAQALGAKLVPEIKSGKYDQAFADNNCPYAECPDHSSASALQGYAGPIFSCPEK